MPMTIEALAIPDVKLIRMTPFPDSRGVFVETYDSGVFAELGIDVPFVQDVISRSTKKHTFRGLHFQKPPHAQPTIVRVARGRIFDVVLDLRASSSSFGRHVSVTMDADDFVQLYLPAGFAHGFCSLEDDTEVAYKLGEHYAPAHSTGIQLDDPALGIDWPVPPASGILSDKDRDAPRLSEIEAAFP
ncbi:MAG: dTDP-4-dehydrorhamnose 3,5-epimerase [Rhodospirillales bacterium]